MESQLLVNRWFRQLLPMAIGSLVMVYTLSQVLIPMEFAPGWDAYFYLVQLKSWVTEGQQHNRDLSLIYPLLRGAYTLTHDFALSYQLVVGLIAGLWWGVMWAVLQQWAPRVEQWFWWVLLYFLSGHWLYFALQWPKNTLGMVAFAWLVLVLSRKQYLWVIVALVACFFTHRLAFGMGGIWMVLWWLGQGSWRRLWPYMLGGLVFIVAVLSVGMVLPGLISWYELSRFADAFVALPQFAPATFTHLWANQQPANGWNLALWGLPLVAVVILVQAFRNKLPLVATVWGLLVLLLCQPFWRLDWDSLGYRLFQAAMMLVGFGTIWLPKYRQQWSHGFGAAFVALVIWWAGLPQYTSEHWDPPYGRFERVVQQITPQLTGPNGPELVIAHKALAEYVTFRTGVDVLPWQPEYEVPESKLWRLAYGVDVQEVAYLLGQETQVPFQKVGLHYVLMLETDWQRFLDALAAEGNTAMLERILSWENPHEERPAYLLKNKDD